MGNLNIHKGFQVLSSNLLEVNPCNLNDWKHESLDLPLHIGPQVLSPNYDMDAYMATLFVGEPRNIN
jgi:hypothetical protein